MVRGFLARRIIRKCGKNINIEKNAYFSPNIEIGAHSGIGQNAIITSGVKLGANVMMAAHVRIYTRNHNISDVDIPMIAQGESEIEPVTIEDDVWIGDGVIILPGVTVGAGSVIGAGSVVTKDVEKFSIVAGNPAKLIRTRGIS